MKKRILNILIAFLLLIIINYFAKESNIVIKGIVSTLYVLVFIIITFIFIYKSIIEIHIKKNILNTLKLLISFWLVLLIFNFFINIFLSVFISTVLIIFLYKYKYINNLLILSLFNIVLFYILYVFIYIFSAIIKNANIFYYEDSGIIMNNYEFLKLLISTWVIFDEDILWSILILLFFSLFYNILLLREIRIKFYI